MRQRHYGLNFFTNSFRVKLLQPEQTPRTVFHEVIATDHLIIPRNNLQDKFDIRGQINIFLSSLAFQITQNLIGRFSDDYQLLRIVQARIGVNSLADDQNFALRLNGRTRSFPPFPRGRNIEPLLGACMKSIRMAEHH